MIFATTSAGRQVAAEDLADLLDDRRRQRRVAERAAGEQLAARLVDVVVAGDQRADHGRSRAGLIRRPSPAPRAGGAAPRSSSTCSRTCSGAARPRRRWRPARRRASIAWSSSLLCDDDRRGVPALLAAELRVDLRDRRAAQAGDLGVAGDPPRDRLRRVAPDVAGHAVVVARPHLGLDQLEHLAHDLQLLGAVAERRAVADQARLRLDDRAAGERASAGSRGG